MEDSEDLPIADEVARRLDLITTTPGAVLKYDVNGDGRLDRNEWELVRGLVEADVVRERGGQNPPDVPWSVDDIAQDPHVDLPVLEVLDRRYEVLTELGRGSQGKTLLARRREDALYVAVKELSFDVLDSWKSLELFEREATVLSRIDHPQIPAFVDSFHLEHEGSPSRFFLVQSFVAGSSLDVMLARGERITESELLTFAREVLEILAHLHELDPPVLHRDIKPANLIRRPEGSYALVDFGGAQVVVADDVGGSTIIGTTGYMPPEQLTGHACGASDLFALGATMVHLATHVPPSKLPTTRLMLDWRGRSNVSAALADFIDRLIQPIVEDRVATAREAIRHVDLLTGRPAAPTERDDTRDVSGALARVPASSGADLTPRARARRRVDGDVVVFDLAAQRSWFGIGVGIAAMAIAVPTAVAFEAFGVGAVALLLGVVLLAHGSRFRKEELSVFADGRFRIDRGKAAAAVTGHLTGATVDDDAIVLSTATGEAVPVGQELTPAVRSWAATKVDEALGGAER